VTGGLDGQLCAAGHSELGEDVRQVGLHRRPAHEQGGGDLRVRLTGGHPDHQAAWTSRAGPSSPRSAHRSSAYSRSVSRSDVTDIVEAVSLDGGLFFQPLPVVERARQLARDGVDIVVTLPLDRLNGPRITGVTRQLLEASVEGHLRSALTAAGYRTISRRRHVQDAMVLDATA
jgi:hypothetical protein